MAKKKSRTPVKSTRGVARKPKKTAEPVIPDGARVGDVLQATFGGVPGAYFVTDVNRVWVAKGWDVSYEITLMENIPGVDLYEKRRTLLKDKGWL
jgi:hypothetical protein